MVVVKNILDLVEHKLLSPLETQIGTSNFTCDIYVEKSLDTRVIEFNSFGYWLAAGCMMDFVLQPANYLAADYSPADCLTDLVLRPADCLVAGCSPDFVPQTADCLPAVEQWGVHY